MKAIVPGSYLNDGFRKMRRKVKSMSTREFALVINGILNVSCQNAS